mgnify:CR=1 FL=1
MKIKTALFIFLCTTLTAQAQQEDFGQDALINPSAATFNFDMMIMDKMTSSTLVRLPIIST